MIACKFRYLLKHGYLHLIYSLQRKTNEAQLHGKHKKKKKRNTSKIVKYLKEYFRLQILEK